MFRKKPVIASQSEDWLAMTSKLWHIVRHIDFSGKNGYNYPNERGEIP